MARENLTKLGLYLQTRLRRDSLSSDDCADEMEEFSLEAFEDDLDTFDNVHESFRRLCLCAGAPNQIDPI